jgi:predicted GNAT superfamily acetyltransferase
MSLRGLAARIKGHDCERAVKKLGSEFSLYGPDIYAGGVAKINVGLFSRKVVELVKATDTALSLDETQYQLCMAIRSTKDEALKTICERIRLQIILAFHELSILIETVKTDPSPETRKKLVEWIRYSSDLSKHAINALNQDLSKSER